MTVQIFKGDMLGILPMLQSNSIDAVVTDPPYHLTSIIKRFSSPTSAPCKEGATGAYKRASHGFMGKEWDGDIAFQTSTWEHLFRVLKPGGHLIAFGGSRTHHRIACAIENAGFEIRDMIAWLYGTGFPKSHLVGEGLRTALKPALEPIVLARKSLSEKSVAANILKHNTGGLNIDYNKNNNDRFPANVIHDGIDESWSKFFYSAKASASERIWHCKGCFKRDTGRLPKNCPHCGGECQSHPTVKPQSLMRYLCKLITPVDGTIIDPFAGTGSTLQAARDEGFNAIGIEREDEYYLDILERLK